MSGADVNDHIALGDAADLATNTEFFANLISGYSSAKTGDTLPRYEDCLIQDRILPLLQTAIVFDLSEPNTVRYRLCGKAVADRVGVDMTGKNLLDFVPVENREDVYADMLAMVTVPCGNYSKYINLYSGGRSALSESMGLPLHSDGISSSHFILSLQSTEATISSDTRMRGVQKTGETLIGADWVESIFIDVGFGTGGLTSLQKRQRAEK